MKVAVSVARGRGCQPRFGGQLPELCQDPQQEVCHHRGVRDEETDLPREVTINPNTKLREVPLLALF